MAITASSLPQGVKDDLRRQLRDQIGWSKYDQLVNALGEDGVVDLILEKIQEAQRGQAPQRASSGQWAERSKGFLVVALVILYWVLVAVFPPLIIVYLILNFLANPEEAIAGLLLLAGLVAAGLFIYWVGVGAMDWFKWLGGYF